MNKLVGVLQKIEDSELPTPECPDDVVLHHCDHVLISLAEAHAITQFVTEEGDPNFTAMDELYKEYGYFIFPGERDGFGWLTACLRTKKGLIVFG